MLLQLEANSGFAENDHAPGEEKQADIGNKKFTHEVDIGKNRQNQHVRKAWQFLKGHLIQSE